jgi:hypothetical protein
VTGKLGRGEKNWGGIKGKKGGRGGLCEPVGATHPKSPLVTCGTVPHHQWGHVALCHITIFQFKKK